jgi:biopolymer transport protein ExbB
MIHRLCHFGFLVGLSACWLGGVAVSGVAAQPVAPDRPPVQEPEGRIIPAGDGAPEAVAPASEPAAAPVQKQVVEPAEEPVIDAMSRLNVWELLEAGGTIGWLIVAMSIALVALLLEHLLSVRTGTLSPRGLANEVHQRIGQGQFAAAVTACEQRPSYLAAVLGAGLAEVELGYAAVEKAMEDCSQQQAARLYRKLEFFTMIGTIAPMLGLLGTVWGMILAFMEFEVQANPQPSDLAPGIYKALVTTLQGLCVAIPALAAYSLLRNRTDELVAETSLTAERVFSNFKRATAIGSRKATKSDGRGEVRAEPRPQLLPQPRRPEEPEAGE